MTPRVVSVSRRSDIPAFHADWFMARVREGYVDVPNPRFPAKVTHIDLTPEAVTAFVFWTRDPQPLLPHLDELDARGYRYYVQMTITGYGRGLEPRVPETIVQGAAFAALSDRLGPDRVVWRYDPMLFTDAITEAWHARNFEWLAGAAEGLTRRCVVSLLDTMTWRARHNLDLYGQHVRAWPHEPWAFGQMLQEIATHRGLALTACAEAGAPALGLPDGRCIDPELLRLAGVTRPPTTKDAGQRAVCLCVESRDIGSYDTCRHGCAYCYASRLPSM